MVLAKNAKKHANILHFRRALVCPSTWEVTVEIDEDKIDEAALALMYLTLHDHGRAWKQFDWEVTNRLYEKGLICDTVGKAKSVQLTDEGLEQSEKLFKKLFAKK